MSDIAIRVENLGKQYRIGALQKAGGRHTYKSLRDSIAGAASLPLRAARRLVGQGEPAGNGHDETFWALKDVSFDIKHGEIVGVIGRNGAGKSTLLKLLSRITEPTTGRVEIHGRVGSLLEVGTGFHPELSGRDNVYMNGAILGMRRTEIARQFDEIVAFAEVEKFIDTPVKHYSSGMYLRLAFAVAAHLQTEILVVDEVLAVGDTQFQKKCLCKMQDVSRHQGRTVLFVSHNIKAVGTLCSQALYLVSGSIKSLGYVEEQLATYMRDVNENDTSAQFTSKAAGNNLRLTSFQFHPNPCSTGSKLRFQLDLHCLGPVKLKDIAVLIYSVDGTRVAILDIRQSGQPYYLSNGEHSISGFIKNVQLVSGDYQIGLYVKTNEYEDNLLDLVRLTMNEPYTEKRHIQYDARYRGFVELDYDVDELCSKNDFVCEA